MTDISMYQEHSLYTRQHFILIFVGKYLFVYYEFDFIN